MKKKSTLYLSRNGLLEPLGQSQVFAYLRGLSRDYNITLITYEKDEDWADKARLQKARTDCKDLGIWWLPQHFRQRPKIVAPAFSIIRMVWLVRREVRRRGIRLIHARSNIPAATALAVSWMTGVPFLFDLRSLFPEELITARRMRRASFLHRAIIWAERVCLAKSAAVISQTHAAVNHLKSVYPIELKDQRLVMIPTCADLDRFTPPLDRPSGPTVHGCIGTILSGWFRTDWLAAWLSAVAQDDTNARFEIVTRDDADRVRVTLDPMNKFGDRLTIGPRPSEEMPAAVRGHDLTVMFYAGGEVSELGRSPTRMAEVLGCGLPVVANEGVGDVADIIRRYNVGVVVKDGSQAAMIAALYELKALRSDLDLPSRCRKAAEEVFSLQAGTEAYRKLYAKILGPYR
ncbi:glycosyltransferase [Amylibacter sp.]|nr:glycosyltransferase [Amylibacter sp.]